MQKKDFRIKTSETSKGDFSARSPGSLGSSPDMNNLIETSPKTLQLRPITMENQGRKTVSTRFKTNEGVILSSRTPKSKSSQYHGLNIKDKKINELLDKIADKEVKQVYPSEASSGSIHETIDLNYQTERMERSQLFSNRSPRSPNKNMRSSLTGQKFFEMDLNLDGTPKSPLRDGHYMFNTLDSKFSEIMELKKQNAQLLEKNEFLNNQVNEVDEFEVILNKKIKPETFNEKRCDILKACIKKQKRHIDYLNKSFRMMNKFYKDLKSILLYLVEVDRRYVRGKKNTKDTIDEPVVDSKVFMESAGKKASEVSKRTLSNLYQEMGANTEVLTSFLKNFNEAYEKFKSSSQKDEEIGRLFNVSVNLLKTSSSLNLKLNPEVQKRVKYNYLFNNFIKQYRKIFPIYTVFNEFELKDKNSFSDFITQMVDMADKIDEILKQVKHFDLIKHLEYNYKLETPEKLINHQHDFEYYFNAKNKNKHMYLNSNEIFKTERQLSHLLDEMIKFHHTLSQKREDVKVENVFKLQEEIRNNVEALLKLGICTNVEFSHRDKIILVDSKSGSEIPSDFMKANHQTEKRMMIQLYNEEYENLKHMNSLTKTLSNLWDDTFKLAKEINNPQLNSNLNNIKHMTELMEKDYKDLALVSKLKSCELDFVREYSRIAIEDIEKLGGFVTEKVGLLDDAFKKINNGAKELHTLIDISAEINYNEPKSKIDMFRKFKRAMKDVTDPVAKVLSKHPDNPLADIFNLETQFKNELEKLHKSFKINSEKIKDLRIDITKS